MKILSKDIFIHINQRKLLEDINIELDLNQVKRQKEFKVQAKENHRLKHGTLVVNDASNDNEDLKSIVYL